MVINVKPATTLAEAADQMDEAVGMCADHYLNVCDVVLSNWSILCRSVDVDALLKLAEELDKEAEHRELSCFDRSVAVVGTRYVREVSRRIREALGVES